MGSNERVILSRDVYTWVLKPPLPSEYHFIRYVFLKFRSEPRHTGWYEWWACGSHNDRLAKVNEGAD